MINSELERIFKSKKGVIALTLILIMPFIDVVIHVYYDIIVYGDFESYHLLHPVYASFLCGSAIGKFPQIAFYWLLPLYFLLLYSDSYISDVKSGYMACIVSRVGKREYFLKKSQMAFGLPFLFVLLELFVNLFLNILIFHGGCQFGGYEDFYNSMGNWFIFGYKHPYIYYVIYIIVNSFICALSGIMGLCCSILSKNYYVAYPAAFFIWLVQIVLPFGIGNTIQPYVEYGFNYFLSGFIIYAAIVLFVFWYTYYTRVKKDDFT